MTTKLKSILFLGLFVGANVVFGQDTNSPENHQIEEKKLSPKEMIDLGVQNIQGDPVLKTAKWGFVVYDPKTKKIISSYNENSSLIPASTTKLLTTDTAMALLGGQFRWTTQLEYSGVVDENGILNGNLYIVGSGDPSLGTGKAGAYTYSALVNEFKYALNEKGIKKINGDIITQIAVFKDNKREVLPENIVWVENGNYYLPAGSTQSTDPRHELMVVKNKIPFDNTKKYFYVSPHSKKMAFTEKYEESSATTKIPDAPNYLANSLRNNLIKSGISVVGKVISKPIDIAPEKRILIKSYKSPTLSDIVYDTNQRSDNALSEALLRMCGFQKKGDQTLESGRQVIRQHLESVNFDTEGLTVFDGSGLSRSNAVTPIAQVKFLSQLMNKHYFKDYFNSLPIGGQTGTLKRSFIGKGYGRVFAKTGTLNGVKTLAGYIKTNSGKTLAFSLMINHYKGSVAQVKDRMERILDPVFDL